MSSIRLVLLLGVASPSAAYLLQNIFSASSRAALASAPAARASALVLEAQEAEAPPMVPESGVQQIHAEETYDIMFDALLKTNESIKSQIAANYALIDYGFLQRLDKQIAEDHAETRERLHEVKEAVNAEMATRMQAAAEALREVLTSQTPVIMEGKIAGFARQGRIDDALLQLLEANLQQAREAGEQGKQAVSVLSKLQERVKVELDTKLAPEIALLRRLMRMDDKDARLSLLREKMQPKKASSVLLIGEGGKEQADEDEEPDVSPRMVAAAIQEMKSRFGNVDEHYDTGFVERLNVVAEEAEAVALDLADGKELTSRQQQDLAWDQASVSVWQLEAIEEEAHQEGNFAVWEEEAQAQMARQDSAMRKSAIDTDWQK